MIININIVDSFQFVCMGGSSSRVKWFAKFIQDELKDFLKSSEEPYNMAKSDRYVLYKVGPVLAANVSIMTSWNSRNLHPL